MRFEAMYQTSMVTIKLVMLFGAVLSSCDSSGYSGIQLPSDAANDSASGSVTVCAYNIFEGARQPERRASLARWLRARVFHGMWHVSRYVSASLLPVRDIVG